MKFQRSTLLLLFLAASFTGAVYFYEVNVVPSQKAAQENQKQIFTFQEDQVKSFVLTTEERTLRFQRGAIAESREPGEPLWIMEVIESAPNPVETLTPQTPETPETTETPETPETPELAPATPSIPATYPANEAYVAFLLNELVRGKSDRLLSATPQQIRDYGLENPQATIDITLRTGETYQLVVGNRDFTGSNLYAQVDPRRGTLTAQPVLLLSTNLENAVDRPLEEWIQTPEESIEQNRSVPEPFPDEGENQQSPIPNPSQEPEAIDPE
ncbi:DUF4340 domain-containing protein [Phormidium pseudopriestleyi FRX01]|uniref:DUF4340 domain-containing protein n=1 Tax=Phormidium pseudopriestleyi FRX01 TaxID=1759528 RepID=A0ABS3FVZ0_9CYAN|nr:DUF4340 domain-containing protein [Phormidium pseudopriestleyi]MBO0350532.1 DUF4340 domain-containing protein [Phormidium pseudopriestleyi FRX01]